MRFLFFILCIATASGQVDESRTNEWFLRSGLEAGDIGLHNAGRTDDAQANWSSLSDDVRDQVLVYLQNNASTYSLLQPRATSFGVTEAAGLAATRLVFDGESTTQGAPHTTTGQDYPSQLMRRSNWVGSGLRYNVGVSGSTVAQMSARYAANVYPYRPGQSSITEAWLIVWIGVNDINNGRTGAATYADIATYISAAQSDGFNVVVLSINKIGTWDSGKDTEADALNALLESSGADYYVDVADALGDPPGANFADQIHPNDTGAGLIADEINTEVDPTP